MANLKINNLKFTYDNDPVFKDLNFTLRKDKTLSVIGISATGKTTLLKLLNDELNYEGEIIIDGVLVKPENFNELRSKIAVVYNNYRFINDTVREELKYSLENMSKSVEEINEIFHELNEFFGISKIMNKSIDMLTYNEKTLVRILSYAVICPTYLAIDDMLCNLDNRTKMLLLNYLNSKNILLINVTSDLEDVIYTDYVLCLYNGICAIDGKSLDVLKEEKILKRFGFSLPFMIDLSIQLKLYGLIDKMYLNKEAMVKNLWK